MSLLTPAEDQKPVTARQLREFGLVLGGFFIGIFGLLLPLLKRHSPPQWPFIVGGVFILWGLLAPKTLGGVYRLWMALGNVLAWINTRLILGIFFYLFITPIGLIMRLTGHDPLGRRFEKNGESYRVPSKPPAREKLEAPY